MSAPKRGASGDDSPRKRRRKDPAAPKNARSAYLYYVAHRRSKKGVDLLGKSFQEKSRLIGAEWRALSDEARAPFKEAAARDRERHRIETDAYRRDMAATHEQRAVPAAANPLPAVTLAVRPPQTFARPAGAYPLLLPVWQPAGVMADVPRASIEQRIDELRRLLLVAGQGAPCSQAPHRHG